MNKINKNNLKALCGGARYPLADGTSVELDQQVNDAAVDVLGIGRERADLCLFLASINSTAFSVVCAKDEPGDPQDPTDTYP